MSKELITIYEVGPRDGLQYEQQILSPKTIIEFINRLSKTGLTWIEAGSFVSEKAVPQMKHTAEVFQAIEKQHGVHYPVLVPNQKGMDAALATDVEAIAVFTAASESFLKANINCGIEESFMRFESVFKMAKDKAIRVRGYISCSMGCPYQGKISLDKVAYVAKKLHQAGCEQICLADTIGVGLPEAVPELIAAVVEQGISVQQLALHFHDTPKRNAIAKILKGIEYGVRIIDSAVGNLGGCPYAPGASGNVATEQVLTVLEAEGLYTGIDQAALIMARDYIFSVLGRKPGT